jgi:hypothetical protein
MHTGHQELGTISVVDLVTHWGSSTLGPEGSDDELQLCIMLPHSMVGVIAATIEIPESVTIIGNNVFRGWMHIPRND